MVRLRKPASMDSLKNDETFTRVLDPRLLQSPSLQRDSPDCSLPEIHPENGYLGSTINCRSRVGYQSSTSSNKVSMHKPVESRRSKAIFDQQTPSQPQSSTVYTISDSLRLGREEERQDFYPASNRGSNFLNLGSEPRYPSPDAHKMHGSSYGTGPQRPGFYPINANTQVYTSPNMQSRPRHQPLESSNEHVSSSTASSQPNFFPSNIPDHATPNLQIQSPYQGLDPNIAENSSFETAQSLRIYPLTIGTNTGASTQFQNTHASWTFSDPSLPPPLADPQYPQTTTQPAPSTITTSNPQISTLCKKPTRKPNPPYKMRREFGLNQILISEEELAQIRKNYQKTPHSGFQRPPKGSEKGDKRKVHITNTELEALNSIRVSRGQKQVTKKRRKDPAAFEAAREAASSRFEKVIFHKAHGMKRLVRDEQ